MKAAKNKLPERKIAMNVYEVITDRILLSLSNGVVPWRKPWATEAPRNMLSGKPYRGVNVFLLNASPYQTNHWVTFNQALDLGGNVRKGQRGTPVVFWKITEDTDQQGKVDKSFLLRYYTVFNVEQCDGIEAPPVAPRLVFSPIAECERIVSGFANGPSIQDGGGLACYVPAMDQIQMPAREKFSSSEEYYSTLFHELSHATGSWDRLNRRGITDPTSFASHAYSLEELVAECGAAFLCGQAGIAPSTIENSAAYIGSWVKKLRSDSKLIVHAAAQAAKAADFVLGKVSNESTEEPAKAA